MIDQAHYLSPTTAIDGEYRDCFGIFETIGSMHNVYEFPWWMLDNGRFTNVWTERKWIKHLEFYGDLSNCLGAVVPDVPYNARGTLEWFDCYMPIVREYGYPVLLATQNGMTPRDIPWSEIDGLFIGGNDEHKRGPEGRALIIAAKCHHKHVHVARVNSGDVIRRYFWMADSWDGRTLACHPGQQYESIGSAVRYARAKQERRQKPWVYYLWQSISQPSLLPIS